MSRIAHPLPPAAQSAGLALSGAGRRWEVLTRQSRSLVLRWWAGGWEERTSEESGVACRVVSRGASAFAAAAGVSARAGHRAAELALGCLLPGPDPLPPLGVLGSTPVPPPAPAANRARLRGVGDVLRHAFSRLRGIELLELRIACAEAGNQILTGEGHQASGWLAGGQVEVVLAGSEGPARLVQWAGPGIEGLDIDGFAERTAEAVLICQKGPHVNRQLADVLLAPAAAAPLVLALVERLQHTDAGHGLRRSKPAPAWQMMDERAGPEGLLPQPFDGEGLPSRTHPLLADGRIGARLESWAEASATGGAAGCAVRPSYRLAPRGGAANLVVYPNRPRSQRELLEQLEDGFWVDLPEGSVRVDATGERFALRAAAVAVKAGRPVFSLPVVELRGTFRRLVGGLAATGLDSQSLSLTAAVTTPSLLFRRLEIG